MSWRQPLPLPWSVSLVKCRASIRCDQRVPAASSGDLNPFGNAYVITGGDDAVSVSTILPKGLIIATSMASEVVVVNQGNNDLVTVTKSQESTLWSLQYEKKYIYH